MDTLVALTAFVRAAELRSLSEAARRLGQTPSAVSRSIARLERELDARLLNRSTHAISLTEAGERFYERAARILRDLDDARDVLREMETRPRGLRTRPPGARRAPTRDAHDGGAGHVAGPVERRGCRRPGMFTRHDRVAPA